MNRLPAWFALVVLLSSMASAQSLGDVARETRKTEGQRKKAARVYTNDDIPSAAIAPLATDAAKPEAANSTKSADAKDKPSAGDAEKKADAKPGDPDSNVQKMYESYRSRLEQQKAAVQLLEREVSVLERENQIQASAYYSDAGTRLANGKNWHEERAKRDAQITDKKAQLEKAKEQLSAIIEDARKAGVPSSATE